MGTCIYRVDKYIQLIEGDTLSSCYIDFVKKKVMNYPSEKKAKENCVDFISEDIDDKLFLVMFFLIYKKNGEYVREESIKDYMKEHKYDWASSTLRNRMSPIRNLIPAFLSMNCSYPSSDLAFFYEIDDEYCFITKNGYYVSESGEKCDKPQIEDPRIVNSKAPKKKIDLDEEGKRVIDKLSDFSDDQIMDKLTLISKDKNTITRLVCIKAIKNKRGEDLIYRLIGSMDNNAEKYNLAEDLIDNGYVESKIFMSVVYAIDNSLYLYRVIKLLLSVNTECCQQESSPQESSPQERNVV